MTRLITACAPEKDLYSRIHRRARVGCDEHGAALPQPERSRSRDLTMPDFLATDEELDGARRAFAILMSRLTGRLEVHAQEVMARPVRRSSRLHVVEVDR